MRVVLDTNTVVSALLWRGTPHRMLTAAHTRAARFYASPFMLEELERVLARRKFDAAFAARRTTRADLLRDYRALVEVVRPAVVPAVIADDPADDQVLACAVEARAVVIVSGNDHLLGVHPYQGIEILNAAGFLARLEQD